MNYSNGETVRLNQLGLENKSAILEEENYFTILHQGYDTDGAMYICSKVNLLTVRN